MTLESGKPPRADCGRKIKFFCLVSLSFFSLFVFLSCSSNQAKNKVNSTPSQGPSPGPKSHFSPLWTNYQMNAGVHAIAFEEHFIWVGTEEGILLYDLRQDKIVKKYNNKNGLLSNDVTSIEIDSEGNKWVGTHGGGLVIIGRGASGKIKKIYNAPILSDPFVYKTLFDAQGKLWVATWKGANFFDGKVWKKFTKENGLVDDWVYCLGVEPGGKVWFGTEGGVNSYDGKKWETFTHKNGLGAELKDIPDYEKIVNTSKHHASTPGKEAEGYNPNYVLSLAVDQQAVKWFGTWGAGLSRFDGQNWRNFTVKDGLPGNFVADIFIDSDNGLWVGTEGGIGYFNGTQWIKYTRAEGLIDDSVFAIARDKTGSKWFGTLDGLSKLEGMVPSL
jgi:ligand-binding sensor domain-containing protein